jgi:hypothetical protein
MGTIAQISDLQASGRCSIRQKARQSLAGIVSQSSTEKCRRLQAASQHDPR